MKTNLPLVFILICLVVGISGQRGGSRRSSSSSDHHADSYSAHRPVIYSTQRSPKNCTTVNGTTTCVYDEESTETSWSTIFIVAAIFGVLAVVGYLQETKEVAKRKAVIQTAFKDFEARMEEFPSNLDQSSQAQLIDQFMAKTYSMVIKVGDKSDKFFCQLKVTDLAKETTNRYRIKLNGKDEVGTSKFEGLLLFRADGLAWKLSKVYDDRTKAEQTGKFQILMYEGVGNAEKMQGNWAFNGFQTSLEYSGTWIMMEL